MAGFDGLALFGVGTVEITSGARAALAASGVDPAVLLARHQEGDWGEVDAHDRAWNAFALRHGHGIVSLYRLSTGVALGLKTTADRARTVLFLDEEYRVAEVTTREGYAAWAPFYDGEKNPLVVVEEPHVAALAGDLRVHSVLDVGTGTGRHALWWARRGATVVGVDQSPEMLAVAQGRASAEGLSIHFVQGALEGGLPWPAGRFDLVVCALMLTHVTDLAGAVREMARVVRPGGYLLLSDLHPEASARGWRGIASVPTGTYLMPPGGHSRAAYLAGVRASGCTVLRVVDVPLSEVPEGYMMEAPHGEATDHGLCLIILAQKGAPRWRAETPG
jgi:2-polyprenyl-3-methyl-5-hydroxy-6-metoxy-1,4-benzoquinol methylase